MCTCCPRCGYRCPAHGGTFADRPDCVPHCGDRAAMPRDLANRVLADASRMET